MFKRAAAFLFASVASANVNTDFADVLNGEKPLDGEVADQLWSQFKEEGSSVVDTFAPERARQFFSNLQAVIEHNSKPDATFKRGLNKFSAMSFDEVKERFHMDQVQAQAEQACSATYGERSEAFKLAGADAPEQWNWQNHGGVSPVKDQGSCGSCWTFSTVGCLESAHLIKFDTLATYAEQQLVDCAGDFENYGCNGGLPSHAFEYIKSAGGIASEEAYPYFAEDRTCTVQSDDFILDVTGNGSVNITAGDEVELKSAVYQQPVSVAFQVVDDFGSYTSGVYTSSTCKNGQADVNHAVLAVGYGTENGMDYWLVKNSWGADWGDNGFFKIERGVNMCGIAMCNSYPDNVAEIQHTFLQ